MANGTYSPNDVPDPQDVPQHTPSISASEQASPAPTIDPILKSMFTIGRNASDSADTFSDGSDNNPFTNSSPTHYEPSSSPIHSHTPSSPSPSSRIKKRANKTNPRYGFVQGAMRGAMEHNAVRRHALPKPTEMTSAASKKFLEMMNSLLTKCEDISVATSCWLFIGAQHIAAKAPTIHYTSPRLLEEAPEFANEQVNTFNDQMTVLLRARRSDAVTVTAELIAAEERNKRLEEELRRTQTRLQEREDLEERYNRLLAER